MNSRRAPRIRVAIGTIISQGQIREPCLTRTVSRTGLSVTSQKKWDPLKPLSVLIVEDDFRLTIEARFVRHHDSTLSFEFTDRDPEVDTAMRTLLTSLLKRAGSGPTQTELAQFDRVVKWTDPEQKPSIFRRRFSEGQLQEISHEGASILTRRPPDAGTGLLLAFGSAPPSKNPLKVYASVVRHTKDGFAVKFEKIDHPVRNWISSVRNLSHDG